MTADEARTHLRLRGIEDSKAALLAHMDEIGPAVMARAEMLRASADATPPDAPSLGSSGNNQYPMSAPGSAPAEPPPPAPVDWERRRHAVMPGPLVATRHITARRTDPAGQLALALPDAPPPPPPDAPRYEAGYLPTPRDVEGASSMVARPILDLWDMDTGTRRDVPVVRRLGLEVLTSVPLSAQRVDVPVCMDIRQGQLAALLWPAWVEADEAGHTTGYRRAYHGRIIREALERLRSGRVAWRAEERAAIREVIAVRDWPQHDGPDATVGLVVSLPPGSGSGPLVDRSALRAVSYCRRQHRLLLTAYILWDRYGTIRGSLVAPTTAVVRRDAAGYVLDAFGRVITERGRPTRRTTHPRAVQTGERAETAGMEARYPILRGDDLILSGYRRIARTAKGRRDQRGRVMAAARVLSRPITEWVRRQGAADRRRPAAVRLRVVHTGRQLGVQLLPTEEHLMEHRRRRGGGQK